MSWLCIEEHGYPPIGVWVSVMFDYDQMPHQDKWFHYTFLKNKNRYGVCNDAIFNGFDEEGFPIWNIKDRSLYAASRIEVSYTTHWQPHPQPIDAPSEELWT